MGYVVEYSYRNLKIGIKMKTQSRTWGRIAEAAAAAAAILSEDKGEKCNSKYVYPNFR